MLTENVPPVIAGTVNGVSQAALGLGAYSNLEPGQLNTIPTPNAPGPFVQTDTNLAGGASPQTVAPTPFQVAATLLEALANTQTSTVGAATSNTLGGVIITEALATAPGATYTMTLTNSQINAAYTTAGNTPQVGIYSLSNTGGRILPKNTAKMTLISATAAVGLVVWVWRNDGQTPLNGTMYIAWHL